MPDYLVSSGSLALEQVLYGLACEGTVAQLVRFDRSKEDGPVLLSDLAAGCLDVAQSSAVGMVIVAETAGLIGAALRRSPATENLEPRSLRPPGRARVADLHRGTSFSASRCCSWALPGAARPFPLRPASSHRACPGSRGHFHAAAFAFRPLQKGRIELGEIVSDLFRRKNCSACFICFRRPRNRPGGRVRSSAAPAGSGLAAVA